MDNITEVKHTPVTLKMPHVAAKQYLLVAIHCVIFLAESYSSYKPAKYNFVSDAFLYCKITKYFINYKTLITEAHKYSYFLILLCYVITT